LKTSAFLFFAAIASVAALAAQSDRARTESLARRATDRLQALQREADRLAADERSLLGDLRKLEIQRQLKAEEIKEIDANVAAVRNELEATSERITALDESAAVARPQLRARLVEIYKLGRARYVRLLLATPDVQRLGQAARAVAALAAIDRQRVVSFQRTLDELTAARTALQEREQRLAALRADAERAQAAATAATAARNNLVRDIDRRRDLNAQLSGELQAAQQKLQQVLRDAGSVAPGIAAAGAALPMRPFQGQLDWPAEGTVRVPLSPVGAPASKGIEIAAPEGAAASAVHDGTVAFAGPFSGFGTLVIVDHGSQTFSLYGDLLDVAVKKGDRVDRGHRLGTVGPTPSGAAGLYFELRVDGRPVDPLQWLKRR
jgi:septal ring factor EnvC (AmiA/AmiB activator)